MENICSKDCVSHEQCEVKMKQIDDKLAQGDCRFTRIEVKLNIIIFISSAIMLQFLQSFVSWLIK